MQKETKISLGLITVVASLGGFLFGFDMAVVSGVIPFIEKQFNLTAAQEGWFVSSALIGCIIGVIFSGELSDKMGRKFPLILSATLFLLSALGCAYMPTMTLVIASRLIGGIGIGIASNVVPLYISEIAPANIRGRLVTYYQFALTFGILVAYLTNYGLESYATNAPEGALFKNEIWRAMFGLGAVPALLFLVGLFIVPESPRWLINNGRRDEGLDIIRRISGTTAEDVAAEKTAVTQQGSYKELFAPGMRKALLIGILLPLFSQFSGINAIIYYGTKILNSAGNSVSTALMSQVIFGIANMLFTLVAVWKVDSWGRRPLYLWGTAGATITLMATGFCFYFNAPSTVLLVCVLAFLACFAFSIGPLKFVVASEIFPNAIRGRALAISIMTMWVADTIVGWLTPVLLTNLGNAGTFWFFAFFCVIAYIVVYKLLPETKGQSLEHIENYWKEKGVDAATMETNDKHIPIH